MCGGVMAKDPAFLFYPGDYLRDTQCLSEAAQVAYDRIMCEHMRNICISKPLLDFFTKRLTPDQKEELETILKKVPGGYQIDWVAESIEKRRKYSDSRRKNRTSTRKTSSSYVPHMENGIENEDENRIKEWGVWGESILKGNDHIWEQMRGRQVTQEELNVFYSVAIRNGWTLESQGAFRVALHGFSATKQQEQKPKRIKLL